MTDLSLMDSKRRKTQHPFPCLNPSEPEHEPESESEWTEAAEGEDARSYSEREREALATPPVSSAGDLMTESQDHCDGVNEEEDSKPSWRPPKPVEMGIWKPTRVETDWEGKTKLKEGDMLAEVYDVSVDLHGKTSGNIHGKVTLYCDGFNIVLFDRDKESALMIPDKGSLPLNGPELAPLGYDPVSIIIDLKIDDDELCKGVVEWDPESRLVDNWLDDEVQGSNGTVSVTYAVLTFACLAELDIKLIESREQITPLRIHGDIVVYINNMQYLRYYVFRKESYDCSTIQPTDPIPLSRSLFCCRRESPLVVKVNLCNSDTNEPLARGALLFPLEYYGEFEGTLGDMIQVKVNYLYHTDHSKTFAAICPSFARACLEKAQTANCGLVPSSALPKHSTNKELEASY